MDTTAPNPMFAKFDQALGKTTPTVSNATSTPNMSRANEIRSMASNPANNPPTEKPIVTNTKEAFNSAADKVASSYQDSEKVLNDPNAGVFKKVGAGLEGGLGIASGLASGLTSPIAGALKTVTDHAENDPAIQKAMQSPAASKALEIANTMKAPIDELQKQHPEAAKNIGDLFNVFTTMLGAKEAPAQIEKVATAGEELLTNAKDAVGESVSNVTDKASNIVDKVSPKATPEELTGKVLQGKTKDIASGKSGLADLDTTKVKTYKDLNTASSSKIKELATKQDSILSQDKTTHPVKEFEKTIGEGDNAVKTNYVKQGIDNLKELYSSTADAKGLAKINALEAKANGAGLTVQEVNQLARDYGSEFGSKAFAKVSGDPLTSVNAQKFENIRTGLKDTARELLPTDESRALDKRMTDQYTVKDLSGKMTEKVNALTQRLQKVNFLQKVGGTLGKALKVTGVGDLASKLLGIDKVPGAATLSPVELEAQLSKNLSKFDRAISGTDDNFVKVMKEMAVDYMKEPKLGMSTKDISISPENFAKKMDTGDAKLIKKYLENPQDLDAYMAVQPALESAKINNADPKVVDKFLGEVLNLKK